MNLKERSEFPAYLCPLWSAFGWVPRWGADQSVVRIQTQSHKSAGVRATAGTGMASWTSCSDLTLPPTLTHTASQIHDRTFGREESVLTLLSYKQKTSKQENNWVKSWMPSNGWGKVRGQWFHPSKHCFDFYVYSPNSRLPECTTAASDPEWKMPVRHGEELFLMLNFPAFSSLCWREQHIGTDLNFFFT